MNSKSNMNQSQSNDRASPGKMFIGGLPKETEYRMDEGELTMIFLDTFNWLRDWKSCWFLDQINAAEIYCERKLKAHRDNLVGIVIFGTAISDVVVHPTNDFESIRKILACLGTEVPQFPNLLEGTLLCRSAWDPYQQMKKRVLVFSAGPLLPDVSDVGLFVHFLKKSRAVVDVVHFGYRPKGEENLKALVKGEENLKALVNAMNNNNNNNKENEDSYFFFIEDDGFSLSHHISSSPILHSPSKAKLHTSVGEEVVDYDWYGEQVVDSDCYGQQVFEFGLVAFNSAWY